MTAKLVVFHRVLLLEVSAWFRWLERSAGLQTFSHSRVPEMSLPADVLSSRIRPCIRCPSCRTHAASGPGWGPKTKRQICHAVFGALHAPTDATFALPGALLVAIHSVRDLARGRGFSRRLSRAADRPNLGARAESIIGIGQHSTFHYSAHSSHNLLATVC